MMRLFLLRHGETVDNVASLYAGSRDSALTNHGVLQCRRLAEHLSSQLSPLSSSSSSSAAAPVSIAAPSVHLFSSNLQRAVKTAEAIRDELKEKADLQQLAELREKDFGSGEGQSFASGAKGRDERPHVGAETAQAMRVRADTFLEEHLLPLLVPSTSEGSNISVVVVAHGLILSSLFKCLYDHLSPGSISVAPEATANGYSFSSNKSKSDLVVLPSWSNTGYLEATLTFTEPRDWASVKMHVCRVNSTDHLKGLRKTRGGIGSARFDEKQKTMESFFTKKRKRTDAAE
jgi:2,3-bisphosphoglycerate-dependent phosphoglycerate mutase